MNDDVLKALNELERECPGHIWKIELLRQHINGELARTAEAVRLLKAAEARVKELEADCREALRVGYQVTLETQTLTDMAHDLVRLVRKGWDERDEAEKRAEAAEFARDEATRRMIDLARENGDLAAALTGLLTAYSVSPFLVSESKGASWDSRPDAREAAQAWYVALVTLSRRKEGTAGDDSEVQRLRSELARVSEEMGLPAAIGPAPGELRRLLADGYDARCGLDFTLRLLAESEVLVSGYMRTPDGKVLHLSELSRMARALVAKEWT